jgi:NAD(P)-dependent dehydrogenase (short-subunit alcohol dehydrogenase family)
VRPRLATVLRGTACARPEASPSQQSPWRGAGCRFGAVDAGDELDVKRALTEVDQLVGPLDVLVLNAGIAQPVATLEALASQDARRVVEVDLLGVIWGLKHGAASHAR